MKSIDVESISDVAAVAVRSVMLSGNGEKIIGCLFRVPKADKEPLFRHVRLSVCPYHSQSFRFGTVISTTYGYNCQENRSRASGDCQKCTRVFPNII